MVYQFQIPLQAFLVVFEKAIYCCQRAKILLKTLDYYEIHENKELMTKRTNSVHKRIILFYYINFLENAFRAYLK